MFYYAQIDENNICIGVTQLSDEINHANMITLDEYDTAILGKKYENGKFIEIQQASENIEGVN